MGGHEPDEEIPFQRIDAAQKLGKIHPVCLPLAVGIDILPQQGNLLDTFPDQLAGLLHNAVGIAAALPAPHIGDNAVGTEIVAAVHDGQKGLGPAVAPHRDVLGDDAVLHRPLDNLLASLQHPQQQLRQAM